jgi:hypothetical protein
MKKSNIKTFLYAHTIPSVATYLGLSQAALYKWIERGYASPKRINELVAYPCSIMTKKEFLNDIKGNRE